MKIFWNGSKMCCCSVIIQSHMSVCNAKKNPTSLIDLLTSWMLHITYLQRNCLFVSPGDRPRKLYAERALNLPLGAELITGNMWYCCHTFISLSFPPPLLHLLLYLQQLIFFYHVFISRSSFSCYLLPVPVLPSYIVAFF